MSTKSVNKIDRLLAFDLPWNPSDDILDVQHHLENLHIHLSILPGQFMEQIVPFKTYSHYMSRPLKQLLSLLNATASSSVSIHNTFGLSCATHVETRSITTVILRIHPKYESCTLPTSDR
jgi:hypothetical protein